MINSPIAGLLLLLSLVLVGCNSEKPSTVLRVDTTLEPPHTDPVESVQTHPGRSHTTEKPLGAARAEHDTVNVEQAKTLYEGTERKLNEAWAKLRQTLPKQEWDDIRDQQQNWVDYRDYFCNEVLRRDLNDPAMTDDQLYNTVEYWRRMRQMTEERTLILRAISDERRYGDSDWTGRWIDGQGGCLLLLEGDDGIFFELQVVRGPTHHTGGIAGHAAVDGRIAHFQDRRPPEPTTTLGGPTRLTFTNQNRYLQVFGTNTFYYHGARAYFDGSYFRVADLTTDERTRMPKHIQEGAPLMP